MTTYTPLPQTEQHLHTITPLGVLQRYLLLGAIFQALTAEGEAKQPTPPLSPYQGHEGQRPGESFTAYRIRVRKEQATP